MPSKNNKNIFLVKHNKTNGIYRLFYELNDDDYSKSQLENYDPTDFNSFYIDVEYPFKNDLNNDNSLLPEYVCLLAKNRIKEMLNKRVIYYSSFVNYSEKLKSAYVSELIEEIIIPKDIYIIHRYWHMQVHPNNLTWEKEKELLTNEHLIGVSNKTNNETTISLFRDEMQIGDVVLIRRKSIPIALVMVIGDAEYKKIDDNEIRLDWFEWRRKIKVLDFYNENENDFVSPIGVLKRSVDTTSFTYRYIEHKYKKYIKLSENSNKLFIRRLKINAYKKIKNFEINFKDINEDTLQLVVLAGINGSGKTSIMELIEKNFNNPQSLNDCDLEFEIENEKGRLLTASYLDEWKHLVINYTNHVIYIKADIEPNNDIYFNINKYIQDKMDNEDYRRSEANEALKNIIDEALNALDVFFHFSCIKNGKVYFENNEGNEIEFNDLSSGEKTLITKLAVLYLQSSKLNGKIVLIDEPETSLHPSWQTKILKLYKTISENCNCQVIIATHSPHIISSTPSESLRVLRDEEGKIKCYTSNNSYGQDFSSILLGVMGLEYSRDPYIQSQLDKLANIFHEFGANDKKFIELYSDLSNKLGNFDSELNLIKLQANLSGKNL